MAFPTIQTADTTNGTVTSNSSSWTLTYPTNLVSGDLILAFVATDGNTSSSAPTPPAFPAGWTDTSNSESAVTLIAGAKISNGSETGTFSLSLGASEQGGWRIFRISGWYGSGANLGDSGAEIDQDGIAKRSTNDIGGSSTPDPPSCNPANWDVEDTLWFAVMAADTSRTISAYPYASNNSADVSGGAGGATLGICTTESAAASVDPGTFTISASDDWVTYTVAVRPAAVSSTVFPPASLIGNFAVPRSYSY